MEGSTVYKLRRPNYRVIFLRPNYSTADSYSEEVVYVFESRNTNKSMLSYTYRQDVASFESPFSVSFTPAEINKNGDTILEIVRVTDIVKIEEHGKVKYMGVVNSKRYAKTMTENGPDRMIVIGGYGIGGVLGRFSMLLNNIILKDATTTLDALEKKIRATVSEISGTYGENANISQIFKKIAEAFRDAQQKIGGYPEGTGIYKIIDKYMQYSTEADRLTTKYPMALSVFSYGDNNLLQIWQELVYRPLYEFFLRWDEPSAAYLLTLRPTPFDPEAWLALKKIIIDPVDVPAADIGFSDDDVKTWFFAYLSGGAMTYEISRYTTQAVKTDPAKWAMYGYRPLEAVFKYADYTALKENNGNVVVGNSGLKGDAFKDIAAGETISDEKLMRAFGDKMYSWFRRADEMAQGSITVMTTENVPTIGERVEYKGAEFYVEAVDGSWQDGGAQETKLTVTRGGKYNAQFDVSGTEDENNWWFKQIRVSEYK